MEPSNMQKRQESQLGIYMPKIKLWESYAWLHRRYVIDRLTEEQIASLANTSQPTIHRALIKNKLKK